MIKVGITGGIGAGKSTVAKILKQKGYPVFISDDEAKKIMTTDEEVKRQISHLFGQKAYIKSELNRSFLADKIFKDNNLREKMNAIVHPAVRKRFDDWSRNQKSKIVFNEAAILFENGSYQRFDYTILVTATQKLRIERIRKREKATIKAIKERMDSQWSESEKKKLASFIIKNNTSVEDLLPQIENVLSMLLANKAD